MALTDYDVYQGLHPIEAIDQAITDIDTVKTYIPSSASAQNKLVTESDIETVETDIEAKQDKLTTTQLAAVNSGATAEIIASISNKQDALSAAQMAAANSGITQTKLSKFESVDSEVAAARVGEDGTSYDTLKDRIDTEISDLGTSLQSIDYSLTGRRSAYDFTGKTEEGGIANGNNYDGNATYRAEHRRIKAYIPDSLGNISINVVSGSDFIFKVFIYNENKEFVSQSDWTTSYQIEYDKDNKRFYRISFARNPSSDISEADVIANVVLTYKQEYADKSLSLENGFAEAKTTGDNIKQIKSFVGFKGDITDTFTFYYGKNVYVVNGQLAFVESQANRCRSNIFDTVSKIEIVPKPNIKVICIQEDDGSWHNLFNWNTSMFQVEGGTKNILQFAKIDGDDFAGTEPLCEIYEVYESTAKVPQYKLIRSVSQESVIDDNSNPQECAMQGMCFDGTNIWYYVDYIDVLRKYNIQSGVTTDYTGIDLGHANDMTFNPNTNTLYVAYGQGSEPVLIAINIENMETTTITLAEFGEKSVCSIAYSSEANQYAVVGGEWYNREGNTEGWTRKKMIIYDANFDVVKEIILKNDYSAHQGIEYDGKYIYFCRSYSTDDKVVVMNPDGVEINSFLSGSGEVEAIAKIDDDHFYIARIDKGYHGGSVYLATVSSSIKQNVVDVLYSMYT